MSVPSKGRSPFVQSFMPPQQANTIAKIGVGQDHEKHQQIPTIEARLAGQASVSYIVLGGMATLSVMGLALVLTLLLDLLEFPDSP